MTSRAPDDLVDVVDAKLRDRENAADDAAAAATPPGT
jgi:hypothetical protein